MSKLISTIIGDVKDDFEGGSSLSVSWDNMVRRGVENVLDKIRPKTLNRIVPVYGGLTEDVTTYYCPEDVLTPNGIYDKEGKPVLKYYPPKQFNEKSDNDIFTIETINGLRMIKVRKEFTSSALIVDEMDTLGTKNGNATNIALNEYNYLTTASIEATFDDSGKYIQDTFTTVQDISDYLDGVAIIPVYFEDKSKIASVEFQLRTDGSNYYSVTSTVDSIGDNLRDGWNTARFSMENRTSTGTPNSASIASWRLIITTTTGQTQTVIVDRITLQKSELFFMGYCSTKAFIDVTTGVWKDTLTVDDYVNFDRDLLGILHYEICILVDQATTNRRVQGAGKGGGSSQLSIFGAQLKAKYQAYFDKFPSEEEPLSYSISPEIDKNMYDEPITYSRE